MRSKQSIARLASGASLLAALLAVPVARAAEPPPLVAPRLDGSTPPDYPEGASGDRAVLLELLVEQDGSVGSARVVDGVEPFASAASAHARSFRFRPARRGDVTVRARVRVLVEFHEPVRATPEPTAPGPKAPARASVSPPAAITEVTVHGARSERTATHLSASEVRQIPGAFGDAFRALEALPGVTPIVSGLPFFFVRGAPPGNVGYFLDGVRVPLLFHLGFGPSVVHPGLVDEVALFPGGYPARYGRFAGGILAGTTKPPSERLRAEGNVRLFDTGAMVESPLDGGKASILVGGRYSYTAAMVSLFAPNTRVDYWDYQARGTLRVSDRDTLGVFAFGSYDYLGERKGGVIETLFATQFHRVDLRWDRRLPGGGTLRTAVTLGHDATGAGTDLAVRDRMVSVRSLLEKPLSSGVVLRAGADSILDHYDLEARAPGGREGAANLYPPRRMTTTGLFGDVVVAVTPRFEVVPGVRLDLYEAAVTSSPTARAADGVNGAMVGIDPRLATRLTLTSHVDYLATYGVAHQPPSFFVPVPGLQPGRLGDGLQRAVQTSHGLAAKLPWRFTFTPTVFAQSYLGMTDATATCAEDFGVDDDDDCLARRVRGRAYGFELLLRRNLTERLTGWVSYTLSRSTRDARITTISAPQPGATALQRIDRSSWATVPGEFDRTHVLNLIGAYDLGRNWRAGARFVYYTGRPYSQRLMGVALPPFNGLRMPSYHRFDARLEKAWKLGARGRIAFVVEWMNFTLSKEAVGVDCTPRQGATPSAGAGVDLCEPEIIGPVTVPSLGVEGSY